MTPIFLQQSEVLLSGADFEYSHFTRPLMDIDDLLVRVTQVKAMLKREG
jgi:hypothetical protein